MPAREKGIDAATLGLIFVAGKVCVIATAIFKAVQSHDGWIVIILVAGGIVLVVVLKGLAKKRKLEYLISKYGDTAIAVKIYYHRYWRGQTREQLIDSLGEPAGKDYKLLKTLSREVWRYNPRGVNRSGLRITLDNEIVTEWDPKS